MRVGLLGPLLVEIDGRPIEVGGARLRTLLVRLALEPGRFVPLDQLVDALWPDRGPASASGRPGGPGSTGRAGGAAGTNGEGRTGGIGGPGGVGGTSGTAGAGGLGGRAGGQAPSDPANAVQSLVSRLRKALGGHPALESGPRGYRLDIDPRDVDACRFERLVAEGRRALRADDQRGATQLLREALELWRGPALADAGEHDAVVARWDELRLAATEDLFEASGFGADSRSGAIAELQELIAAHPLRERLVALLVRALHADGRQAEALVAFEECRLRLADQLGADPSPELRDAHMAVLRAEARPPRSGNLRAPLTSFVGRDDDVERLATQVADTRLVTLVGPGGAGKTRLATTVASTVGRQLPDGAWLVEFASVTEASEVPAAVLRTLASGGLVQQDAPRRPRRVDTLDQLADALTLPGVLLVLDNCEHVVDAAAKLSEELLGRCPKLRILATSREPLGILGETLFPVGPLPLPEPLPPGRAAPDRVTRDRATQGRTTQESADQHGATQDGTTQDSATHDSTTRYSATHDSTTRYSATHDSTTRYSAAHDRATLDRATHDRGAQGGAIQNRTAEVGSTTGRSTDSNTADRGTTDRSPRDRGSTARTATGHDVTAAVARASASPAVQLLKDRAAAVRPGFTVTDGNVGAVVEICRRLDGLPLAIELAAARLRSFTPEQVAARLDDRFRLLTGGSRTALPRHRTLHAVVAWSWDLLGQQEREFAESMAVFPGTFDADAAAAVSGVDDAEELLDALVDRSLLQVAGGSRVRYRMLETIREFALEELGRRGGAGPARAAHAAYFLDLMERAEPHLRTGAQLEWLDRLRPEQDNVYAAVAHVCDAGDGLSAFRLGAASGWFWTFEDNHAEAAMWLERILAVADSGPEPVPADLRLVVMSMYVVNSGFAGDFQVAGEQLDELIGLAAAAPLGGHPFVALIEPVVLLFRDDSERGGEVIRSRLASSPDAWTRAMLLSILGHLKENDGDIDGMVLDLTASAAEFRRIGERWGLAMTLASIAEACTRRGDFASAVSYFEESIELHGQLGIRSSEAYLRVSMAALRRHTDGPEVARTLLRGFVEDATQLARDVSHAMLELGHLARATGDIDEAERLYVEAWRLLQESPLVAPQYKAIVLAARAEVAVARGEHELARARLAEAMTLTLAARDMPVVGRLAVSLAGLTRALGDPARSAQQLGAAEQLAGTRDAGNADWTARLEALRDELGETAFETALARGLNLPRAEALELVTPD